MLGIILAIVVLSVLQLCLITLFLTDRLTKSFLDTQERLERSLTQNRTELQSGLTQSTGALETKFHSLEHQMNMRLASLNTVGQSISDLNNLLKLPHLRGGFGEASLERLLSDFLPYGSYELQYTVVPGSAERVDAVVKLPKQLLPIDSKFPREQVLPLFESQDPHALEGARRALSDAIRVQAKSIAQKYIRPDHGTSDMALLYLPSETLYFEVIRNIELFEGLSKLKVFPVSPNTLAIALRSISIAQEYYEMAKGVEKTVEDVKKAQRHFEHFERKFEDIGKGLRKAQEAFETATTHLGHYESSVVRLTGEATEKLSESNPTISSADTPATPPVHHTPLRQ